MADQQQEHRGTASSDDPRQPMGHGPKPGGTQQPAGGNPKQDDDPSRAPESGDRK
jgi:hypothetical protein